MRRYLPAAFAFASILLLAGAGFVLFLQEFRRDVQQEFDDAARTTSALLQRSLSQKLLLLESLHTLFAVFDGRPQPEFRRFAQPFERAMDGVRSLQWIQPVTSQERLAHETAMQLQGAGGYMISEHDAQGRLVRAGERPLYFPLYPLAPTDEGGLAVGFDLASDPERSAALYKAVETGELTLTRRVELLLGTGRDPGFLAFKPLHTDEHDQWGNVETRLHGLVVGAFHFDSIFRGVLESVQVADIAYTLRDTAAPAPWATLLEHGRPNPAAAPHALINWQPELWSERFSVGDREWELVAAPAAGYMAGRQPDGAWFILSIGVLLACILASYLVEQARHVERMADTEAERSSLENQLFRSQKMEAIGRLVGGIAHDFNNLLTSISGYAELALVDRDPARNEEYLRLIQQGGERGKGLIQKLLSFSRNDPMLHTPQVLSPLVEQTLAMLKPVMPPGIDIQFACDEGVPPVSIDTTSLDQVLVNLCINARDAIGHKGAIRISVRHGHVNACNCSSCEARLDGNFVMLGVEDTGEGIPAEALGRIFKPFYTTKGPGRGTGLGLSIIHNITHGCRGHILVSSHPGVGTQVRLLFPAAETAVVLPLLRRA